MDDEFGGGGAAAGLDEPASLKAELWSDEDSSGQEPEDEEFGALHAAGAGTKGARSPCTLSCTAAALQPAASGMLAASVSRIAASKCIDEATLAALSCHLCV